MTQQQLPLHALHAELGAKFGPFAGFEMPLYYGPGIMAEHRHTRASAGLFDISHMVLLAVEGPAAGRLLSVLCPFDAGQLAPGTAKYTFFLNENAGIIDDVIVSCLGEHRYLLVCNAARAAIDQAHIDEHAAGHDVEIRRLERVFLALQGPAASKVLQDHGVEADHLTFMKVFEPDGLLVSRSGYTGEDGFEIAIPTSKAEQFFKKLVDDERVLPVGLAARDSLRLEAGLSLYGQDLDETITPLEAGLVWAIPKSHRQGGSFVGATALAHHFAQGRKRKRVGLKPAGRAPVRSQTKLFDEADREIGVVTSGGYGPSVDHPVALGLVEIDFEGPIHAMQRGKKLPVEIADLPFVPHQYHR